MIAALLFFVALWYVGSVLLPFLVGGAVAYFLDPVADRLERWGLSRALATLEAPGSWPTVGRKGARGGGGERGRKG